MLYNKTVLTPTVEVQELSRQVKAQKKGAGQQNELNEFMKEASAFFTASRRKKGKGDD